MGFTFWESPTGIPNHPIFPILFLVQDGTQSNSTGIGMQLEGLIEISKGQDWGGRCAKLSTYQRLSDIHQSTESFSFYEQHFLWRSDHKGVSNFSIMLGKISIIVYET